MSVNPGRHTSLVGASAALICLVLGACGNSSTGPQGMSSSGPHPSGRASKSGVQPAPRSPAWVAGCFQKAGRVSTSDQTYIGLTKDQALAIARGRGEQLVLVGAGGRCMSISDDVAYRAPVAVAFATGSPRSGVPPDAKVVYATSDRAAKYEGWGLH
jgi:hypothetical protein